MILLTSGETGNVFSTTSSAVGDRINQDCKIYFIHVLGQLGAERRARPLAGQAPSAASV